MTEKAALSFSGGKDSCFALYKLQKKDVKIASLVTTIWKKSGDTVAHDEKREQIVQQADRLGLPVYFIETDFDTYTEDFVTAIKQLKAEYEIDAIAFGDIYLEGHREWGEQVALSAGVKAMYPIWTKQEKMMALLHEVIDAGFKAKVIKVDGERLPTEWEGRLVNREFAENISAYDVCPMGESGEYHTTVLDGPIFEGNRP
ncbi:Dph6-related ATP pyrophosphatase [Virgibacillus siamensis]|uniref:Dph6-related ATP pyrophosphatase n=1 Tax=Virgibacillus siamensis TaxID=480071 RepID=UPI00098557B7|nr:diphthine--ammonia ligase [Virgibacillus siamensis]